MRKEQAIYYPNKTYRWVWLGPSSKPGYVECVCACGTLRVIQIWDLEKARTHSCGCYQREVVSTHGGHDDKLYYVWRSMRNRCFDESNPSFHNYGGRGIVVEDADWIFSYGSFRVWALASGYREGLQLDRRDNNRGYSPENCRFVTAKINTRNGRRSVSLTAFNETKVLAEWAEDSRCLVSAVTLGWRIKNGWTPEGALTTPATPPALRKLALAA